MSLELLPAVNVGGIPKDRFDVVRDAALRDGISDTNATVVRYAVVELARIL